LCNYPNDLTRQPSTTDPANIEGSKIRPTLIIGGAVVGISLVAVGIWKMLSKRKKEKQRESRYSYARDINLRDD
jgi:hypothetical protein